MTISISLRNFLQKCVKGTKKENQGLHTFMLLSEYMFCLRKKRIPKLTKTKPKQNPPVVFFSRKPVCKGDLKQWQVLNVQLWSWMEFTTNTERHRSSSILKNNYGTITRTKQKYSWYIVFISMITPHLPSMLKWPKTVILTPTLSNLFDQYLKYGTCNHTT